MERPYFVLRRTVTLLAGLAVVPLAIELERGSSGAAAAQDTAVAQSGTAASAPDGRGAVLAFLFGAERAPLIQRVSIEKPFGKFANVTRTVEAVREIDRCRYEIDATVASDDEMAGVGGTWKYAIDFSKIGAIDVKLADNAYEALAWSPIMFLYPAQKEMARHHRISKVFRVTLNSKDKTSYCGTNLTSGKPATCFGGRAFEIAKSATNIRKLSDSIAYFKSNICKGEVAPPAATLTAFPFQGKWAPSVKQCIASNETDADDSIVFERNRLTSGYGSTCIARSLSIADQVVSSVESCGGRQSTRRTKIVDSTHIVLNYGDSRLATKYVRCSN